MFTIINERDGTKYRVFGMDETPETTWFFVYDYPNGNWIWVDSKLYEPELDPPL